jgi:hypothetical protein
VRPTAIKIGIDYDPYDLEACEFIAHRLLDRAQLGAVGSVERGRKLLSIVGDSFPTPALTSAYFENLTALLADRPQLSCPGRVLIGLGTGRSGSTTLSALLGTIESSCSTHENPPLIFWRPREDQIEFQLRRFSLLIHYFQLVADVSHWWLHVVEDLVQRFPNIGFIGLIRDEAACAESFMAIKKSGPGSYNHWVPFGNGVWAAAHWDPTYPSYETPSEAADNPDLAKKNLILRYIREYNSELSILSEKFPDKFLLLRTEDLNKTSTRDRIFRHARFEGHAVDQKLNARSVSDGRDSKYLF